MTLLFQTPEGLKVAKASGTADNSGGSAAADIDVEITVGELAKVNEVLAVYVTGSSAYVKSLSSSGNKVTVTVNVPAGETAGVEVVVLGY